MRILILLALLISLFSGCSEKQNPLSTLPNLNQEVSPEEFAREFGLPTEGGTDFATDYPFTTEIPRIRVVPPTDFKNFQVTVDVFRQSESNPLLGSFQNEYIDDLSSASGKLSPTARATQAEKRFNLLNRRAFAIISKNGEILKAYLISGAVEKEVLVSVRGPDGEPLLDPTTGLPMTKMSFKTTPSGNYRLDPIVYTHRVIKSDGTKIKIPVAFPWIQSKTYGNSQMYWGLWIHGGYFIHSTPHYGELGRPASMGCIRQSFPDAQDLFKLLVEEGLSGMIRIHALDSNESISRLSELTTRGDKDFHWLLKELDQNEKNIQRSIEYFGKKDLEITGHGWFSEEKKPLPFSWPTCGEIDGEPIDCFKTWSIKKKNY